MLMLPWYNDPAYSLSSSVYVYPDMLPLYVMYTYVFKSFLATFLLNEENAICSRKEIKSLECDGYKSIVYLIGVGYCDMVHFQVLTPVLLFFYL